MTNRFDHVLRFRIALKGIRPPIWRRIQVPCTYTFWDLHVAIQDSMGWQDYHLHLFRVRDRFAGEELLIGIPDDGGFLDDHETLPSWEFIVARHVTLADRSLVYEYDFGDDWQHSVTLEKIMPRDSGVQYPICVGGRRACPPEDCGGLYGYEEFLDAVRDPCHEEHERMLAWAGGSFDSEEFDKTKISFDNPAERWNRAFRGE